MHPKSTQIHRNASEIYANPSKSMQIPCKSLTRFIVLFVMNGNPFIQKNYIPAVPAHTPTLWQQVEVGSSKSFSYGWKSVWTGVERKLGGILCGDRALSGLRARQKIWGKTMTECWHPH